MPGRPIPPANAENDPDPSSALRAPSPARGEGGAPGWSLASLEDLFAGLDIAPSLLLAVSGGPDSMAMMHLAAAWRAGLAAGPALHVASVDHGLRPASRAETELVAREATARGLPHAILTWDGEKPAHGLQEKAREARYALLAGHARSLGVPFLLTAHHADDQAETVLMRLGHGSGVTGLAGMRRESVLESGVTLMRPLLDVAKADLLRLCRDAGIPFAEDPSNADPAYLRARLRHRAGDLAELGLDRAGLARLARRMARADAALEAETDRLEALLRPVVEPGSWRADLAAAREASPEILLRLLGRALRHVAGRERLALEKLESAAEALQAALAAGRAWHANLAGALLALDARGALAVSPEPPRRRPAPGPRLRPN